MRTAGNLFRRVLKAWAASLKRIRSTVILFSVPSSWAWSSLKFSVALSSGYFSTTTSRRDRADDSPSWASWNWAKASGVSWPGVDLDLADLGPGLGHGRERVLLEGGRALDRLDEVGDEVGPPLVVVLDLAPLGLDLLVEADERVVDAGDVDDADQGDDEDDSEAADGEFLVGHCDHSPNPTGYEHSIIRKAAGPGFLV